MSNSIVYLVSSEDKDYYCLDPLSTAFRECFDDVKHIDIRKALYDNELLREICGRINAIFVYNSRISFDFIALIMGSRSYISIGLEHGIGPYKKYTYGRHLIDCDIYFAPTKLWADRLINMYAPPKGTVLIGGYQRLSVLLDRVRSIRLEKSTTKPRFWSGLKDGVRKLVIFSWHLNPEELKKLPDTPEIVYLLHPADAHNFKSIMLSHAEIVISTPSDTAELIAHADIILGDFSSLTIEAAATGTPTYYFVARSLYKSDCDMDSAFFQIDSPHYAKIPHSKFQLAKNQICDLKKLMYLLESPGLVELNNTYPLDSVSDFMPPANKSDGRYIAESVKSYAEHMERVGGIDSNYGRDNLDELFFIKGMYLSILGRNVDFSGALHYMRRIASSGGNKMIKSAMVISELANSSEAKSRWEVRDDMPFIIQ